MIGKLTYDQIEEILTTISNASNNLRTFLDNYSSGTDTIAMKAKKVITFCNEVDRYVEKTKDSIELNKDVDKVINELKEKNNLN